MPAPDDVDDQDETVYQLTEADFNTAADEVADRAARMPESRGLETSALLQGAALFEETLREQIGDE